MAPIQTDGLDMFPHMTTKKAKRMFRHISIDLSFNNEELYIYKCLSG